MERIEIPEDDRISAWVEAVERGDEVVVTRDGTVVAEIKTPADRPKPRPVFDPVKLAALHATLGPLAGGDVTRLVREMRDADDH